MNLSRRRLLAAGAGLAAGGLAGCTSLAGTDGPGGPTAQASIFVCYDFGRRVAGTAATVESVVPPTQHGHAFEPSTGVQRDVQRADAFVYVGEGFQIWADRVVENLKTDAPDVTVVEAWHGVDLLPAPGEHDQGTDDHESGDDHGAGSNESDHDEGVQRDDARREGDDGHDHAANRDPHFWLDPTLATTAVENVRDGFAAADPDGESTYRENAADYADRLADLDAAFESELSDRSRDAVLVAGHDSFQYLARRYGFEVHGLTGLTPDAEPSPRDVSRAQAVIDEHDVEHVLAPALESDRAATHLVRETDATGTLPITAVAGLTPEWQADDWGYADVMERVNLPSLKTALGAT